MVEAIAAYALPGCFCLGGEHPRGYGAMEPAFETVVK